mmetsp:Transcript_599/g.1385  ORF Transcript_599/g.1385 Transcript_599/m.1385 type:complete len:117 (-) Transcript_599:58-408(-)|eukprot:CAMPEP_0185816428 /NCGR_PEP_ID=MMETSP1322-20130828/17417_1 /TAXON_ID=265543 /ORGANISM="Minutocellus polymorphus, Strain RCC2270" /LENGTH=116 /DNA_ID=CAMNT_0028513365 /DNA_START=380 /DNA_END=730 /DNA_ORIENTATION=+
MQISDKERCEEAGLGPDVVRLTDPPLRSRLIRPFQEAQGTATDENDCIECGQDTRSPFRLIGIAQRALGRLQQVGRSEDEVKERVGGGCAEDKVLTPSFLLEGQIQKAAGYDGTLY